MKEIVLDTETTGISVKEGHRIVEIGCIELENLIPTKNKFHCYLNPERKVSEKALEIHGYTDEFLIDKKKFNSGILSGMPNYIETICKKHVLKNALILTKYCDFRIVDLAKFYTILLRLAVPVHLELL